MFNLLALSNFSILFRTLLTELSFVSRFGWKMSWLSCMKVSEIYIVNPKSECGKIQISKNREFGHISGSDTAENESFIFYL